jgi:DNA repair protein RecN (Recombination protein N)
VLLGLAIRDIVLIEALELDFRPGLTVLTGETGAGKSILLDALGFALGRRPGRETARDLVRAGRAEGVVTATFGTGPAHPVQELLAELGLPGGPELILRRIASAEGPSRAFVNDHRIGSQALARIGALLVEVHGQHDDRSLLDPRAHAPLLDAFDRLEGRVAAVRGLWAAHQASARALAEARAARERAAAEADYLRHSVDELERLAPQPDEDAALDAERRLIKHAAGLTEEIGRAAAALSDGATGALGDALQRLTRVAPRAEGRLEGAIAAIDRTMVELAEAEAGLAQVLEDLSFDPGRLERVEERLFAIRALARKHGVLPDELAGLATDLSARLADLDASEGRIEALAAEAETAERAYQDAAAALSTARREAAAALDAAVTAELGPLRMEAARFLTEIGPGEPGPEGRDRVRFTAAINPGAMPGPIDRIASGGELSRFLLALKVRLAGRADGLTMIFDEIDRGVGGATADAVGRRLLRLARSGQVIVVTHSPQVAALGHHHLRIAKSSDGTVTRTEVTPLDAAARNDEIARMLAGGRVTEAARSAAAALIGEGRG